MSPEQIAAVVDEIRRRVRARHEKQVEGMPDFCLPSLDSLGWARDAAESKAAAIGSVNPRPSGPVHSLIQLCKQVASRLLRWHVREQIEFNRAVIQYMDRTMQALDEHNHRLLELARHAQQYRDEIHHLQQWRTGWEEKWTQSEVRSLRAIAELQAAFQHRVDLQESNYREQVRAQHGQYLAALDRAGVEMQKKLWADVENIRREYERLIHEELRMVRQKAWSWVGTRSAAPVEPVPASGDGGEEMAGLDWLQFAERFRGSVESVAARQKFYLPYFAGRRRVLDLGCGRGEFLELLRQNGVAARGVDLQAECVALCRQKELIVEQADLFEFLAAQPKESLDGVFCAQVVEHLSPSRVWELVVQAARALERGGLLALETPNPECLAIFATHFYVDPTHRRPVPSALLRFYLQENGFGALEVHPLAPAEEEFGEIGELARQESLAGFQKRFFGALDYAILGRKL